MNTASEEYMTNISISNKLYVLTALILVNDFLSVPLVPDLQNEASNTCPVPAGDWSDSQMRLQIQKAY